jgi:hypothetical protein
MKQTRALHLIGLVLASTWMIGAGTYAYPGVTIEFEQQHRRAQLAQQHPPMIPTSCADARGVEQRDFVREDGDADRCWVNLESFRRLYPEIAPHTDEDTSAIIRKPSGTTMVGGEGSPWTELLRAAGLAFGPPILLVLALVLGPSATRTRKQTAAHGPRSQNATVPALQQA